MVMWVFVSYDFLMYFLVAVLFSLLRYHDLVEVLQPAHTFDTVSLDQNETYQTIKKYCME